MISKRTALRHQSTSQNPELAIVSVSVILPQAANTAFYSLPPQDTAWPVFLHEFKGISACASAKTAEPHEADSLRHENGQPTVFYCNC